jgi:hypothetical protein
MAHDQRYIVLTRNTLIFISFIVQFLVVQSLFQTVQQFIGADPSYSFDLRMEIMRIVAQISSILEFLGITQLMKKSIEAEELQRRDPSYDYDEDDSLQKEVD